MHGATCMDVKAGRGAHTARQRRHNEGVPYSHTTRKKAFNVTNIESQQEIKLNSARIKPRKGEPKLNIRHCAGQDAPQ